MSFGPLEGVRVIDLTRLLPGGYGLSILADLGAEVIKIEQPGIGDYMRWAEPRIGSESAQSWVVDRNKRSVSLNLKDPRGVEALKRLAGTAELLFESFRPGVCDRLGLGYDALREVSPRLVYCSISGYGQHGPLSQAAGHDINYVARAGILGITGPADGPPVIPGVQIADVAGGGLLSLVGALAALVRARATGVGEHVDISMTDAAFSLLSIHHGVYWADDTVPEQGRMLLNGYYPCYNVYRCADGRYLALGPLEEQFWEALCRAVGRPELEPTQFDPEAVGTWRALFLARSRDEWLEALEGVDACVGPVNDLAEASRDPQVLARAMVVELEHPTEGPTRQVGVPIKLRHRPGRVASPAPHLGEHTRPYLSEVGYSDDEIERLLADGVAAEPVPAP